jgi:hypothetical protein
MESVRFLPEVPQFDLPRLERGLVQSIIDQLTDRPADKPAVIANPQGGWTALRGRLVDDLEARGQLLPQQLKVVLGGLRTLRWLTPAAYARIGRVAGLEAAFVEGALNTIKKIARAAPVMRRLRNSIKTAALTPPFSMIMNRIWPREVIAEMRLMPWRAPVVSTTGVSPFLPQLRPA